MSIAKDPTQPPAADWYTPAPAEPMRPPKKRASLRKCGECSVTVLAIERQINGGRTISEENPDSPTGYSK